MLRRERLALSVPVREMARLERRAGRRSAFWKGAAFGATIGGIGRLGLALTTLKPAQCVDYVIIHPCDNVSTGVTAAFTGALGGGMLGGILGAIVRRDRWQGVSLEAVSLNNSGAKRGAVFILLAHSF
jgi:hypothetical protein